MLASNCWRRELHSQHHQVTDQSGTICSVGINGNSTTDNADVGNVTIVCTHIINREGLLEPSDTGFGSVLIDQTSTIGHRCLAMLS